MAEVAKLEDWEAAFLQRASRGYLHPTRVEMKHARLVMCRGLIDPIGGNAFKVQSFTINDEGRAALAAFVEEKNRHNRSASDCGFLPVMIQELEDYRRLLKGERIELCDAALEALRALEIPFRK